MTGRSPGRQGRAGGIRALGAALGIAVSVTVPVHAAEPSPPSAEIATGRVQYVRNCSGCHGMEAMGDGPDAHFWMQPPVNLRRSDVLERYPDSQLVPFLRDGARLPLAARPGAFKQHEHETEALVAFLPTIPDTPWERVDAGVAVYINRCLDCHDEFGRPQAKLPPGVKPPRDLSDPAFQRSVDDATLRELVRHGRDSMPALVPRITEAQAGDLVAYVRVLSPGFTLYDSYCMGCHGPEGQGGEGITAEAFAPKFAFDKAYFAQRSPDKIRRAVWHMLRAAKPTMPHFSADLTESEARAIFAYLRSLPPEPAPPAAQP